MGYEKKKIHASKASKIELYEKALLAFSSNLYASLVKDPEDTRFLKVICKDRQDWLVIIGLFADDGTPIVAFGQGISFAAAMRSLSGSMAADRYSGDKYAGGGSEG